MASGVSLSIFLLSIFCLGSFSSDCFFSLLGLLPMNGSGMNFFQPLVVAFSFFNSFRSASPKRMVLNPIAAYNSSGVFISCSSHNLRTFSSFHSISSFLKKSTSLSSPACCMARCSRFKIPAILALALAVVAKLIHAGCTCCDLEVRISTWSPLFSLWLNGTSLWFTFAPIQWLPKKVWMEKAKSRAVQFCGMVLISPFGVKMNISEAKRFSLMVSRKSMASGCGSSKISLMVRSHFSSSPSSS